MTPEQAQVVEIVYDKFLEGEMTVSWDALDDQMIYLDYLSNNQLWLESNVLHREHTVTGTVRCSQEFCNQGCYAQTIVEAVGHIILENQPYGVSLTTKHRYVLEQYLALSQLNYIVRVAN